MHIIPWVGLIESKGSQPASCILSGSNDTAGKITINPSISHNF